MKAMSDLIYRACPITSQVDVVGQATPHNVVLAPEIEGNFLLAHVAPPLVVRRPISAAEPGPPAELWPTASHTDVEGQAMATSPTPEGRSRLTQFEPASVVRRKTKLCGPAAIASHVEVEAHATE